MELLSFEQKVDLFNQRIVALQKEYGLSLYAANVVLKNGEVVPLVRVADAAAVGMTAVNEKNEDKSESKKGNPVNKKTQPNRPKK